MKELLTLIIVADWLANDLHYRSSGSGFYEKHLLADRIRNVGSIDELKESYFLGFKTCLPPLDVGLAKSATFVYEKICSQCNGELQRLELVFTSLIDQVEQCKKEPNLPGGIHSILDGISQKALTNRFLVSAESGKIAQPCA